MIGLRAADPPAQPVLGLLLCVECLDNDVGSLESEHSSLLTTSMCPLMNRYTAATGPYLYPDKTSTRYRCMECLLSAQDAFSFREPARQSNQFSSHSTASSELQTILDSD